MSTRSTYTHTHVRMFGLYVVYVCNICTLYYMNCPYVRVQYMRIYTYTCTNVWIICSVCVQYMYICIICTVRMYLCNVCTWVCTYVCTALTHVSMHICMCIPLPGDYTSWISSGDALHRGKQFDRRESFLHLRNTHPTRQVMERTDSCKQGFLAAVQREEQQASIHVQMAPSSDRWWSWWWWWWWRWRCRGFFCWISSPFSCGSIPNGFFQEWWECCMLLLLESLFYAFFFSHTQYIHINNHTYHTCMVNHLKVDWINTFDWMNHMYHTCILIREWFSQTRMVNHLKVGLDWLGSILWAKQVKKKKKKKHVYFPSQTCYFQTFECLHKHEYYVLWHTYYVLWPKHSFSN